MIQAVVFDMDGVLIDAQEWHYEALNRALGIFGMEISRDQHLTTFDGLPTATKLEMVSLSSGLPRSLHGFVNKLKQRYTMEIVYERCRPVFEREYAMSTLRSDGFRLAVASNSIPQSIDAMLTNAALIEYIEFFLSNRDVLLPKPDPEIYSLAISRLGLMPHEVLVVEDNEKGITAAKGSGAHVLEVASVAEVTYLNIRGRIDEINKAATVDLEQSTSNS